MNESNLAEDSIGEPVPIRGDLTQGPILRTLISFAVPTLGTSLLQSLNLTINTIWLGQLLGEGAVAATSNASTIGFLSFAAVFGFSMATAIQVGQRYGARNLDGVRRAFAGGLGVSTALTVVAALVAWLYVDELLDALSTPVAIREDARVYLNVVFAALPFTTVAMLISTGLRGCGDARTPLYATILSTLISALLNPVLILGFGPIPPMGIGGSALTLVLGNFVSAGVMLFFIYRKDLPLRLRGADFGYLLPSREELAYIMGKGLPMGAQTVIATFASLVMVGLVNREGLHSAAAYGAILQLWGYIQMPALAFANAVSAMVAQNIGAGQHDRVSKITSHAMVTTATVTMAILVTLIAFDEQVLSLFLGSGSSAIPIAEHIDLYASWAWVLVGMSQIYTGSLRAYGVVIQPMVIMSIAYYPGRLGFYFLFYPYIGADALWLSFPFGALIGLILAWVLFTRGRWRRRLDPITPAAPRAGPVPAE